jgi:PTH1 family peptidyl-tRNA hydrolase
LRFWQRKKSNVRLIVGLGNPGQNYTQSRHNIGSKCLSHFAREHGIRFDKKQCQARTGLGTVAGSEVVLARPQTFMNRSGDSVGPLVRKFRVGLDNLIVIHDDLDLPLGKIRIRPGGSSAGHKGIGSIIENLGSQDFARIRVGIGRPPVEEGATISEDDIIDWVLSEFTPEESEVIAGVIPRVGEAIDCLLTEGVTAAMNRFN